MGTIFYICTDSKSPLYIVNYKLNSIINYQLTINKAS